MKSHPPVFSKRSGAPALKRPFLRTGATLILTVKLQILILCLTSLVIRERRFYSQKTTLAAAHRVKWLHGQYAIMVFAASSRRVLLISSTTIVSTIVFCQFPLTKPQFESSFQKLRQRRVILYMLILLRKQL